MMNDAFTKSTLTISKCLSHSQAQKHQYFLASSHHTFITPVLLDKGNRLSRICC